MASIIDGNLVVPKRLALSLAGALAANALVIGWTGVTDHFKIAALEESDNRIMGRGDLRFSELKGRIEVLERDRDRLTKVETIVLYIADTLKAVEVKLDRKRP